MHFSMLEKLGLGLLVTAWVVWGANQAGNLLVHAEMLPKTAYDVGVDESAPAGKAEAAEVADAVDALTLLASADAAEGEKAFKKCKACHTTEKGGKHKVGPNLWNVVGSAKGAGDGFSYSGAITEKGGDWSYKELDGFLADPRGFIKGTKMSFAGVRKAGERAAVIVYLRSLSDSPKPLP